MRQGAFSVRTALEYGDSRSHHRSATIRASHLSRRRPRYQDGVESIDGTDTLLAVDQSRTNAIVHFLGTQPGQLILAAGGVLFLVFVKGTVRKPEKPSFEPDDMAIGL